MARIPMSVLKGVIEGYMALFPTDDGAENKFLEIEVDGHMRGTSKGVLGQLHCRTCLKTTARAKLQKQSKHWKGF